MGTSVERHSAQTDLSKKAEGYGISGERIDGMDVTAVREGVAEGIRQAREERRPTLLEAFTYRYRGHSAADPEVYREREEEMPRAARELAEAGAAYGGQPDGPRPQARPNPAEQGDAQEGVEPEVSAEVEE